MLYREGSYYDKPGVNTRLLASLMLIAKFTGVVLGRYLS
jgi:hypothetical protein